MYPLFYMWPKQFSVVTAAKAMDNSTLGTQPYPLYHDVFITEGTMTGDRFATFVKNVLFPQLMSFNGINPRSVVIMDNASIHHVQEVIDLIETQAGAARVLILPPYSPDLNPVEGIFSQIKSIMREYLGCYIHTF